MTVAECKAAAGKRAASFVESGMIVGLGTGSTAAYFVQSLGERVAQGLKIIGVPTSEATRALASSLSIPLGSLDDYPQLDIVIDGADEVERGTLNLIKGLGGALLREKLVAQAAKRFVVIVDATKPVECLGERVPVPVEVVPFGSKSTVLRLRDAGAFDITPRLTSSGDHFITDNGNFIFDCNFGLIRDVKTLSSCLDAIVGVVEHGIFAHMTSDVIIATEKEIVQWSE
ncbi:ribose-5-phosphate isomerase RpiA [Aristophania vespae]|uniref:Ribose-5-phosphate isomerase A n=1 Tax=Aristophania vespae TaxID=2697033 RepID=A0A6P1NHY1_9PROT|nr:ribose-5-phosphate isomerase RpiA [Aristophania vespae]QHI95262.1 ribose-5-phosphate isomerase RpiA [Aristophania vespae]